MVRSDKGMTFAIDRLLLLRVSLAQALLTVVAQCGADLLAVAFDQVMIALPRTA